MRANSQTHTEELLLLLLMISISMIVIFIGNNYGTSGGIKKIIFALPYLIYFSRQFYIKISGQAYILVVLFVAMLMLTRLEPYKYPFNWDDYSHWALSVKLLYLNEINEDYFKNILFSNYIPIYSSWLSTFQSIKQFDIALSYLLKYFYISIVLLYILSSYCAKCGYINRVALFVVAIAPIGANFTPSAHNLLIDDVFAVITILALMKAAELLNADEIKTSQTYPIFIALPLLLSKQAGYITFAAITLSYAASFIFKGAKPKHIIILLFSMLTFIFVIFTWNLTLNKYIPSDEYKIYAHTELLSGCLRIPSFFGNFFDGFFIDTRKQHVLASFALLAILSAYMRFGYRYGVLITLYFLVTAAGLITAYIFVFYGGDEFMTMNSMPRYMYGLILPIIIVVAIKDYSTEHDLKARLHIQMIFFWVSYFLPSMLIYILIPSILFAITSRAIMINLTMDTRAVIVYFLLILVLSVSALFKFGSERLYLKIYPDTKYLNWYRSPTYEPGNLYDTLVKKYYSL